MPEIKPKEGESKTLPYRQRSKALWDAQDSWRLTWKEVVEWILTRRGKYLVSDEEAQDNQAGKRTDQKVINGVASDAVRVLAAGLQGGLTSPSRPWFTFTIPDVDLMEYGPVRNWLHDARNLMLLVFSRSNFYGSIHGLYEELGGFGTSAMIIEEDFTTVIRCRPLTIGEFALGLDSTYRPNALYRRFSMTALQMVQEFGAANVSTAVKSAVESAGSADKRFMVHHGIQPARMVDPSKADYRSMSFESVHFQGDQGGQDIFLRKGGYRGIPFVAPRWKVNGVNTYGDSPGIDSLGDVRMLQKMEADKLEALDKMVRPPMNAPLAMKGKGGTIIPGGVNFVDVTQGQQGFTPAYQTDPRIQEMAFEIDRVERRIKRFYFNDLFLTILGQDKQMTAEEVARRHEEKIMMLGPVLEILQAELLDIIIDRTYSIMDDMRLLPPPPKELVGMELKTQYISILAQAQKAIGTVPIQQTAAFVTNMAAIKPDVVDKFDFDQAVDEFSDLVGCPPRLIVSDDKVAENRAARAKQEQQLQAQQAAAMGADAAKKLSEAKVNQGTLLDAIAQRRPVA